MARAARGIGEKATSNTSSIKEISEMLRLANEQEFDALKHSLASDTRKGVIKALEVARKRIEKEKAEKLRLEEMYSYQQHLASKHNAQCVVGLDEVGRGPVAGPLTVAAVILPETACIENLNDSKQLSEQQRELAAMQIKEQALAWSIVYISPQEIDEKGMSACLKKAFASAIKEIENQDYVPDLLLLDGNPLHFDKRECNVVKGDSLCASIAAASIIAKVDRDALMVKLAQEYPQYHWAECKGYASSQHVEAIKQYGLSPYHRESFCRSFTQPTLFDELS